MKRKLLAGLLTLTMLCSLLPSAAFAGGVADGSNANSTNSTLEINKSIIAFGGMEWNLIGNNVYGVKADSNCLTLLKKDYESEDTRIDFRRFSLGEEDNYKQSGEGNNKTNTYYEMPFEKYACEYSGSLLHQTMEKSVEKDNIPEQEKNLIQPRTLLVDYNHTHMYGPGIPNQKYWLLSLEELKLIQDNDVIDPYHHNVRGDYPARATGWWLRSGSMRNAWTDAFFAIGYDPKLSEDFRTKTEITFVYANPVNIYARPAMYLKVGDAVFLSSVKDGKSADVGSFKKMDTTPEGTLKFTMKSKDQQLNTTLKGKTDSAYVFNYSNATTGANQYISCVLTDKNGAVKYYGKLKAVANSADRSGTVEIPKSINGVDPADYTVKIFNEKIKDGNYTDFCSAPQVFNLENVQPILTEADLTAVHGKAVNVTGGDGSKQSPCTATVQLDKSINQVAVKDLAVSKGATAKIYDEATFMNEQMGILLKDGDHHLYVKVTAGDGTTTKYYDVTIPRESKPTPPPAPSGDNYVIIVENDGHGSASATMGKDNKVTLTATPHSGYVFDKWEVTPADVKVENNSFTMPKSNVTVKAHFKADPSIPDPKPEEQGFDVAIHPAASGAHYKLVTGDATQNDVTGAIDKIVFEAEDGYVFPDAVVKSVNGITGKVSADGKTLTITGTPTDNVDLTMLAAVVEEKAPVTQSEALVTFKVENGTWADGTEASKTAKVVLTDGKGSLKAS